MTDTIYFDFFMIGEHFTVEDYAENSFALYHEDCFVAELPDLERDTAYDAAFTYLSQTHY